MGIRFLLAAVDLATAEKGRANYGRAVLTDHHGNVFGKAAIQNPAKVLTSPLALTMAVTSRPGVSGRKTNQKTQSSSTLEAVTLNSSRYISFCARSASTANFSAS